MSNNQIFCKSINQIKIAVSDEMMAYWKNINKKLIFFRLDYIILLIIDSRQLDSKRTYNHVFN